MFWIVESDDIKCETGISQLVYLHGVHYDEIYGMGDS